MSSSTCTQCLQQLISLQQRFRLVMHSPFLARPKEISIIYRMRVKQPMLLELSCILLLGSLQYLKPQKLNRFQKVKRGSSCWPLSMAVLRSALHWLILSETLYPSGYLYMNLSALQSNNSAQYHIYCLNLSWYYLQSSFSTSLNLFSSVCCRFRSYSSRSFIGQPILMSSRIRPSGSQSISMLSEIKVRQLSRTLLTQQVYQQSGRPILELMGVSLPLRPADCGWSERPATEPPLTGVYILTPLSLCPRLSSHYQAYLRIFESPINQTNIVHQW